MMALTMIPALASTVGLDPMLFEVDLEESSPVAEAVSEVTVPDPSSLACPRSMPQSLVWEAPGAAGRMVPLTEGQAVGSLFLVR